MPIIEWKTPDKPTREQEIVRRLIDAVDHPFGGYGSPDADEKKKLIAELLAIPRALTKLNGGGYAWSDDDMRALIVLATLDVPIEKVAKAFGRSEAAVYFKAKNDIGDYRLVAGKNWIGRSWSAWQRRYRND